ncbi:hypothetical protein J2S74_001417 [Evansella vedderi]|uniref:Uncharacterized protein n=1 Tax=Evansella vedderi TaxID=38282 RepID=A0ABT9ZS52_9BACI|nr:hypothetical protein [Evansella vedderi]MDQ0254044.1 hypothetical protein [Evansella vedderi]
MKRLSQEQFERAVNFIFTNARPLDRRVLEYHFFNGEKSAVLNELMKYQNKDGGVGKGIEPDIQSVESSPIATSVAMQYAREVQASWQHPFVKKAMKYFTDTYNYYHNWPLKMPHMNNFPHADWWHFNEHESQFEVNPGAEIVGYYHTYPQIIPEDLLPTFHDHVFQHLENRSTPIEFHEALCYLRLAEEIPDPGKTMIVDVLREWARDIVTLDPSKWGGYCAKPLWLAPTPNSPLYNVLEDVISLNLDYEIEHQQEDGSWVPFWEWGQYRDVWENKAKKEWQGALTVKTLYTLKNYERLEVTST